MRYYLLLLTAEMEYRLIPLMVSVIKIGDELSAAALTRGLGAPVRRTNVCEIGFHVQDFIAIVVCFPDFVRYPFFRQSSLPLLIKVM